MLATFLHIRSELSFIQVQRRGFQSSNVTAGPSSLSSLHPKRAESARTSRPQVQDDVPPSSASSNPSSPPSPSPPKPKAGTAVDKLLAPGRETPIEHLKHRHAMKTAFPSGWNPPRKLSRQAMSGLRLLHHTDPHTFSTPVLAERFKISPEAVRRILKSRWEPKGGERVRMVRKERERKEEWIRKRREGEVREWMERKEKEEERREKEEERGQRREKRDGLTFR